MHAVMSHMSEVPPAPLTKAAHMPVRERKSLPFRGGHHLPIDRAHQVRSWRSRPRLHVTECDDGPALPSFARQVLISLLRQRESEQQVQLMRESWRRQAPRMMPKYNDHGLIRNENVPNLALCPLPIVALSCSCSDK